MGRWSRSVKRRTKILSAFFSSGREKPQPRPHPPAHEQQPGDHDEHDREADPDADPGERSPEAEVDRGAVSCEPVTAHRDDHRDARVLKAAQPARRDRLPPVEKLEGGGDDADRNAKAEKRKLASR